MEPHQCDSDELIVSIMPVEMADIQYWILQRERARAQTRQGEKIYPHIAHQAQALCVELVYGTDDVLIMFELRVLFSRRFQGQHQQRGGRTTQSCVHGRYGGVQV